MSLNNKITLEGSSVTWLSRTQIALFCFYNLTYLFWLCWVSVAAHRLSLVAVSGGCSLAAVHGPLIAVASLAAEHRLQGTWASVAEACGLRGAVPGP